jgi:hypothetical protein
MAIVFRPKEIGDMWPQSYILSNCNKKIFTFVFLCPNLLYSKVSPVKHFFQNWRKSYASKLDSSFGWQ